MRVKASETAGIVASIQHKETKKYFDVMKIEENPDCQWQQWGKDNGATHILDLFCTQSSRFCKILKTVAYVMVDETENGPVWEKWPIKFNFGKENI